MEKLCDLVKGVSCKNCPLGNIFAVGDNCPVFRSSTSVAHYLTTIRNDCQFIIDQITKGEVEDR